MQSWRTLILKLSMITKEDQNARGFCIFNTHIYQESSNADDVCELQSTKLATGIYFYLQLQQSDPRPRACSLSVLTLLFFWYVSDKFKFIQLETQHAGKFMTTVTYAHDLNFILIFHFLHFFLSFKLNYNPCSNTKPSISGIHYVYYQYFQNRNIGNYTITDFPL